MIYKWWDDAGLSQYVFVIVVTDSTGICAKSNSNSSRQKQNLPTPNWRLNGNFAIYYLNSIQRICLHLSKLFVIVFHPIHL